MKTTKIPFCLLFLVLIINGCRPMSETIQDKKAGFNGGFETFAEGLPVNWNVYTAATAEEGEFGIGADTTDYIEGMQSLCFSVKSCSPKGGHFSPGLSGETEISPGGRYQLIFWAKNTQSTFRVRAGGVTATSGDLKTLVESNEQIDAWKEYSYNLDAPEDISRMRVEINVLSPGQFRIDNIRLVEIK